VQLYFDGHRSPDALLNAKPLFQAAMPVGGIGVERSISVMAAVMAVYGVRQIRQSAAAEAAGESPAAGSSPKWGDGFLDGAQGIAP
jgi:hypothetical protein